MLAIIAFVLAIIAAILLVVGLLAETMIWTGVSVAAAVAALALVTVANRRRRALQDTRARAEDVPDDEELPPAARSAGGLAARPDDAEIVDPLGEDEE